MNDVKIHHNNDIDQTSTPLSEVPLARFNDRTASHDLDASKTDASDRGLQEQPSDTRHIDDLLRHVSEGWDTALNARRGDELPISDPREPSASKSSHDDGAKRLVESLPGDPSLTLPGDGEDGKQQLPDDPVPADLGDGAEQLAKQLPGEPSVRYELQSGGDPKKNGKGDHRLPPADDNVDEPIPQNFDEEGRWTQDFDPDFDGRDQHPN
ncbi:MAG: hypothetical protein J2P36_38070 [Ktedonobacteraceae bacterium]|nr:hypothetical protein [Ktedonobacteraceae bacterium]